MPRRILAAPVLAAPVLAAAILAAALPADAADYRLQQGDVLKLVVVAPPLHAEMPIDIDGNVTLPIAGAIPAAGRSLAEVTTEARARLAAVALPPAEGETLPVRIWPQAVSLGLSGYRPVYVGGQVRAGGAFPFSPGLTARRAIVLAGGHGPGGDRELQRLDLEGRLAELRTRQAAARARRDRLRLELDADAAAGALAAPERGILALRRDQDAEAAGHYAAAIRHTEAQIGELSAQLASETEGMAADKEDFDRIAGMRGAGTATALRLSDARRALLFSTTRQLQTATELARTTRELGSVRHEQRRQAMDLRLKAMTDLGVEAERAAVIETEIAALDRQLAWLDGTRDGDAARVAIIESDGDRTDLAPGEDKALRPGDMVVVTSMPASDM